MARRTCTRFWPTQGSWRAVVDELPRRFNPAGLTATLTATAANSCGREWTASDGSCTSWTHPHRGGQNGQDLQAGGRWFEPNRAHQQERHGAEPSLRQPRSCGWPSSPCTPSMTDIGSSRARICHNYRVTGGSPRLCGRWRPARLDLADGMRSGGCACRSPMLRVADIAGRRDDDFRYGERMVLTDAFRHVLGTDSRMSEYTGASDCRRSGRAGGQVTQCVRGGCGGGPLAVAVMASLIPRSASAPSSRCLVTPRQASSSGSSRCDEPSTGGKVGGCWP